MIGGGEPEFSRGDCNADGSFNIADAIFGLDILFGGMGTLAPCEDSCDANDDGGFNIADNIYMLTQLFSMGPDPLPPFPGCGVDPTSGDPLDCVFFPPCP